QAHVRAVPLRAEADVSDIDPVVRADDPAHGFRRGRHGADRAGGDRDGSAAKEVAPRRPCTLLVLTHEITGSFVEIAYRVRRPRSPPRRTTACGNLSATVQTTLYRKRCGCCSAQPHWPCAKQRSPDSLPAGRLPASCSCGWRSGRPLSTDTGRF